MNLARSAAALLVLCCGLTQAQQIPKYEPDAKTTYDRFKDLTWYEADEIDLSDVIHTKMEAMFPCQGDTGEQPCRPSTVVLRFSYQPKSYKVFDPLAREVIAIADGRRIPLGQMAVSYERNLFDEYEYKGVLPVSLGAFRQLAASDSLELAVGRMAFTFNGEQMRTLGSFYNMAVLNAKQSTLPKRGKPRRRKS